MNEINEEKLSTLNSQLLTLRGQTLIETVTALAVVIILVSSLVMMAITSVRSSTLSNNKSLASQLAYRQLEQTRSARDSGYATWSAFAALFDGSSCTTGAPCHTSCNGICSIITGSDSYAVGSTTFTIKLYGAPSGNGVQATAEVSWTDSLGPHSERLSTIFTNWQ